MNGNQLKHLAMMANELLEDIETLAKNEGLPPDFMVSVVSNAVAMFAAKHGIDHERYLAVQAAMIQLETERRKGTL